MTEPATGEGLARLLAVQDHDSAIDRLRHRRASLPERAELADVRASLAATTSRRRAVESSRDDLLGRQRALESEVDGLERRRGDLQRKLATGTVPKELERLSAEVEGVRTHIGELEDREIELMEAIEPLDVELVDLERMESGLDERRTSLRAAVAEAERMIDEELAREQAARDEAAAPVAADLRARYEQLRARMDGVAVARLVGGRCTGCNLALPTSEVDRIRHEPPDTLVTCDQCGRLLAH